MTLKLYFDCCVPMSRALYIFLRTNGIPFEPKIVDLKKGEQFQPKFQKINPLKKIPVIEHNGFLLIESSTILRYLCREFHVDDHWYPKDSQARAKVEERLDWHQTTIKSHVLNVYFVNEYRSALLSKNSTEPETERHQQRLIKAYDRMEKLWLRKNEFLTGSQITIADLYCACDVNYSRLVCMDLRDNWPRISAWLDRVARETEPYYQEAHVDFDEKVDAFEQNLISRRRALQI